MTNRNEDIRAILDKIEEFSVIKESGLTPDQRSTYDQVKDLIQIANQHGMYDAADWLKM